MRVKPANEDLRIPIPGAPAHARWLPADGAEVPDDPYWRRLLRDGSVVPDEAAPARKGKE